MRRVQVTFDAIAKVDVIGDVICEVPDHMAESDIRLILERNGGPVVEACEDFSLPYTQLHASENSGFSVYEVTEPDDKEAPSAVTIKIDDNGHAYIRLSGSST